MRYSAVVFDVDGTLFDTRSNIGVMQRAYHRLFPERDRLPYAHFVKCYSMTGNMTCAYLNIAPEQQPRFLELLEEESPAAKAQQRFFDGIAPVLHRLHDAGYLLGINTSRERWHLEEAIREHPCQLWGLFGLVITQEVSASPKPAPDSLLYFMEQTGTPPAQLLFVGDSINDSLCAARAGCDFALACWGCTEDTDIPALYRPQTPDQLLPLLV